VSTKYQALHKKTCVFTENIYVENAPRELCHKN